MNDDKNKAKLSVIFAAERYTQSERPIIEALTEHHEDYAHEGVIGRSADRIRALVSARAHGNDRNILDAGTEFARTAVEAVARYYDEWDIPSGDTIPESKHGLAFILAYGRSEYEPGGDRVIFDLDSDDPSWVMTEKVNEVINDDYDLFSLLANVEKLSYDESIRIIEQGFRLSPQHEMIQQSRSDMAERLLRDVIFSYTAIEAAQMAGERDIEILSKMTEFTKKCGVLAEFVLAAAVVRAQDVLEDKRKNFMNRSEPF